MTRPWWASHHKKSAGAIYQTALRAELSARLPGSFGAVSEHGEAEIAGVPEAREQS